ncbi:hypothetical protein [Streptomyces sp. NBC_01198]|uniref:hypothetical protein n=1 Tax=Streptomyces sp. NBC_01198 TaxID=2903769 RepID=UPI002E11784F|nr:hypothetical protein OG702_25355 [Streptomyces sp. NBC_01198]
MTTPASDARLRKTAEESVQRWLDETERAVRGVGADAEALRKQLTGVTTAQRRAWWAQRVQEDARESGERLLHDVIRPRRAELADQVFVLLQQKDPRPTEQELGQPTEDARRMLAGLAPATAAGGEILARVQAASDAVAELIGRVPTLDALRTGKTAELALARQPLVAPFAHVDQVVAAAAQLPQPQCPQMVIADEVAACTAVRGAVPDERRFPDDSDRSLRQAMDDAVHRGAGLTLEEQRQAIVGPFDTALAATAKSIGEITVRVQALDAAFGAYTARVSSAHGTDDPRTVKELVDFYGTEILATLCALPVEDAQKALMWLTDRQQSEAMSDFQWRWPADTPQRTLRWAFSMLADYVPYSPDQPDLDVMEQLKAMTAHLSSYIRDMPGPDSERGER